MQGSRVKMNRLHIDLIVDYTGPLTPKEVVERIKAAFPDREFDNDVMVEIDCHSGKCSVAYCGQISLAHSYSSDGVFKKSD